MNEMKEKLFSGMSLGPKEAENAHNYRNKSKVKINNGFKLVWGCKDLTRAGHFTKDQQMIDDNFHIFCMKKCMICQVSSITSHHKRICIREHKNGGKIDWEKEERSPNLAWEPEIHEKNLH